MCKKVISVVITVTLSWQDWLRALHQLVFVFFTKVNKPLPLRSIQRKHSIIRWQSLRLLINVSI